MTSSSLRPASFPWVSPYIIVTNIDTATDFYIGAFGFTLKEKVSTQNDGVPSHAEMFYKDQIIMFGKEGEYQGKKTAQSPRTSKIECPVSLYLYCEGVDKFSEQAVSKGAKLIEAPADMAWGDRICCLQCPEGYRWTFATYLGVPCHELKKNKN
jgi:uncharacterized glyoxalase superfamily protein PhnB